jgi:hypothetical protein
MAETVMALASRADSLRAELSRFRFHGAPATISRAGEAVVETQGAETLSSVDVATAGEEEPNREETR